MTASQHIAIVGAGPAGLTAALVAHRLGLEVTLFEQAPNFERIGGGILLHSNGQRVLEALGLLESFRPQMRFSSRLIAEKAGGGALNVIDYAALPIPHACAAIVLRYHLQEHLLQATMAAQIPVHFDHRCTGLTRSDGKVRVQFANGVTEMFDVVIACDGVHSRVRTEAGVPFKKVAIGEGWIRGVADYPIAETAPREMWGADGRRFGIAPLQEGKSYFYARVPLGRWPEILQSGLDDWIESWREYGPQVMQLLRSVDEWGRVNYSELHEIRMPRWYEPPLFFVGDAAHAMTPNLGQGANSSMVDALVLMQLLAQGQQRGTPLAKVGEQYDVIRRPFVTRIQSTARQMGQVAGLSNPVARRVTEGVMGLVAKIGPVQQHTMYL
ncbi:MAG: FAD-dependent monooxygenase, partial [Ardenticatenales bacterium]|nr:FAD-dependent monooxygenase [Ardenticatenales bacterium]